MKRLKLNFQVSGHRPRRVAGWVLFSASLLLITEMGFSYINLERNRDRLSHEVQAVKTQDKSIDDEESYQFLDEEFVEAKQIIKRLSTPWDQIFIGLDSVRQTNVAILSMKPDLQAALVRIDGEAKDYAAVLTFIARLKEQKQFSDVFLNHHEVNQTDLQHPIRFELSMHWLEPL